MFLWLQRFFSKAKSEDRRQLILPADKQLRAWHKANQKMAWGIKEEEFDQIESPPPLSDDDRHRGYIGPILCYGFGDEGKGNSDSVSSGRLAWEYAVKRRKTKTWNCGYVHFEKPDHFRLRPEAPPRPKGFYYARFQTGERFKLLTVNQVRKRLKEETGCGPEGLQFLTITHIHFQGLMNKGKMPFMALADYDVAPHGFNDFFDAPQLFVRDGVLALGIGNVDNNYPLFGIPTIRFQQKPEGIKNVL
jgi:hypothetical protein